MTLPPNLRPKRLVFVDGKAETPFGRIRLLLFVLSPINSYWVWRFRGRDSIYFPKIDEAIADAQRAFDRLVMESLEPIPENES
jgi:hypothetical protein